MRTLEILDRWLTQSQGRMLYASFYKERFRIVLIDFDAKSHRVFDGVSLQDARAQAAQTVEANAELRL